MKISVIVPLFNVEQYLPQCIESILAQSYRDLEVILVDDGSTDNSAQICDEYAEKDGRITVIHQKNSGAANARNAGLKIATGECLAFVDSDDYLNNEMYSTMMKIMEKTNADIIECAFANVYKDEIKNSIVFSEEKVFSVTEYLKLYTSHWICGLLWDKLFKKGLFRNIYFEEGHQIDDEFFTYQGVMNARKIVYTPMVFYNYRMRMSGLMRDQKATEKIFLDRLESSTARREKVVSRFPELKQEFDYSYLDTLLFWSREKNLTKSVIQEIQRLLNEYFKLKGPCKMSVGFRLQLLQLQLTDPEKILKKNLRQEEKKDENQYYE